MQPFHSHQRIPGMTKRTPTLRTILAPLLGLLLVIAALAAPAYAQERSVVVERRDAAITVLPNGDVRVVETWRPRFIGGPFRFADFMPSRSSGSRISSIGRSARASASTSRTSARSRAHFSVEDDDGEQQVSPGISSRPPTRRASFSSNIRSRRAAHLPRRRPVLLEVCRRRVGDADRILNVVVSLPSSFDPAQL